MNLIMGALNGWSKLGAYLGLTDDWISTTPGRMLDSRDLAVRAATLSEALHWRYHCDEACFIKTQTIEARHWTRDGTLWDRIRLLWEGPHVSALVRRTWGGTHTKLTVVERWTQQGHGHPVSPGSNGAVYDVLQDRRTQPTDDTATIIDELRTSMPQITSVYVMDIPGPRPWPARAFSRKAAMLYKTTRLGCVQWLNGGHVTRLLNGPTTSLCTTEGYNSLGPDGSWQ